MNHRLDYNDLAAEYAKHRRIHPGVLQQLGERGAVDATSAVLEVGCGTGNYLIALHEQTDCLATGIDPSASMLTEALGRSSEISWKLGQAERIPAPGGSIDLLFSVDVIHHVRDRAAFFAEAARVLTPGGLICTATDSAEDIARRRPLSSHFPETVALELARYPAIETLGAEMVAAGFTNLTTSHVELEYPLSDLAPYRDRAYSSLHLITEEAFQRGLDLLEAELADGPVSALSLYTLVWGARL